MVYFIQSESGGPIKIGYTGSCARKRLANLQTGSNGKLILLATTKRHEEKALHARFADLRLHGEWFKASVGLMAWIRMNTEVTDDGRRVFSRATTWI